MAPYNKIDIDFENAVKCLVEGCIFVSSTGLTEKSITIDSQPAHFCSHMHNQGYNNNQKITVVLKNNNLINSENKNINEFNENNVRIDCYSIELCSNVAEIFNDGNIELFDMIEFASVVVSHIDGDENTISIECIHVKHNITINLLQNFDFSDYDDNRSAKSMKYCVHKNMLEDFFENVTKFPLTSRC